MGSRDREVVKAELGITVPDEELTEDQEKAM